MTPAAMAEMMLLAVVASLKPSQLNWDLSALPVSEKSKLIQK